MISTRGRYALRVMIDIAEHGGDKYITLDEIAERQEISEKYLEGILATLTKGNMLIGVRGKGGGYKLTRRADEYTVGSIIRLTEGSLSPVACLKDGAPPCGRRENCKTLPVWKGLDKLINDYLDGIKLSDLLLNSDEYYI